MRKLAVAVKVVLTVLFVIFEAVPTFRWRLGMDGFSINILVELIGSPLGMYVIVTAIAMVWRATRSFWMTAISFGVLFYIMDLCKAPTPAMIMNLVFIVVFVFMIRFEWKSCE